MTRRRFLLAGGTVAGSALAAGATAYGLREILTTIADGPPGKTLVLVTLYGGCDGLSTVIPYADEAYAAARPALAYSADQVLRLDDTTGLNPALTGLHRLYGENRVAVVRGVGYPKPDRSHFKSMDIWQTGQPERPGTTGWLGRWLDLAGRDPRLAVSFEPVLPMMLAGATCAGATVPDGAAQLPETVTPALLRALAGPAPDESAARARAAECFGDLLRVRDLMAGVDPAGRTATAASPLDTQLALVARCVEAGAATRVYSVSLGGFDLHADEQAPMESLLAELDRPLSAFADRMAGRDVLVAVYSEFGRRVRANASDGTDHGTASSMFLIGDGVRGGLHGEQPSLTDLHDGDLVHTIDFRDVYATLLHGVLGADPERVLDGWTGRLDHVLI